FERGTHRLNAVNTGMGIGLAIVRAIAQAHGGRAEYRRSERLGGACFSLVIPGCVVGPGTVTAETSAAEPTPARAQALRA
ncbi:MAG TPA: ATP-binding protein, partial [Acidimicrobiia bacterium]|nr:ATP-binding protein [Acidimicrobiia bacterium]